MDVIGENGVIQSVIERGKAKQLTSLQRKAIVSRLLLAVKPDHGEMNLLRGTIVNVAREFHVSHNVVGQIWKRALANFQDPQVLCFWASPQKKVFVVASSCTITMKFTKP